MLSLARYFFYFRGCSGNRVVQQTPHRLAGGEMLISRLAAYTLAAFFFIATGVLFATGAALIVPGSPLDAVWHLYEYRRVQFMPFRWALGPVFLVLSLITGVTAVGCVRRRRWGLWFAIGIFVDNGLGYVYQLATGNFVQGAIGLVISALLVFAVLELMARGGFD